MQNTWWYWLILVGVNAPVFIWIGRWFFGGWEGFWECIRFWFTPDMWSMFQGEWADDLVAELKLGAFFGIWAACVYGEHLLLTKFVFN